MPYSQRLHLAMRIHLVLYTFAGLGFPSGSYSQQMETPSFSCEKPTSVEKTICTDKTLAALDRDVGGLYSRLLATSNDHAKAFFKKEQRDWIKGRNSCDGTQPSNMGDNRACIERHYKWNLASLAPEALFADHELAIAVLAQVMPEASPLYEAIYVYASINDHKERLAKLEAALDQTLHELKQKPSGRSFKQFNSATDIVLNDEAFTHFIGLASALVEHGTVPMTLPCQAIIKRPALLKATGPQFGGGIDAWVIRDNCDQVLAATPQYTELAREVMAAQKQCLGTIRFSLGRMQTQLQLAIRVHDLDGIPVQTPNRDAAAFEAANVKAMGAAGEELASDYISTFALSPGPAAAEARRAVQLLVDRTFQIWDACGIG
jgi:uncharacterized protein YecT (DUF1311 family)